MREPVIGIDLGTTNSVVATVERGKPDVIPSRSGDRLTPSMVGFDAEGRRVVGEAARALSESMPENVAFATKRYIGRRWSPELAAAAKQLGAPYALVAGPQEEVRLKLAGRTLPLTQISAMILVELKLDAQAHFGRPVTRAVVTVPANFDDAQRRATKEAAEIAGLEVLRIINEPTAAAVAYGLSRGFEGRCLVFDLGGGTFDVSILEIQSGVFEVKATGGDPRLGGEDFDQTIVGWLLEQLPLADAKAIVGDKLSMRRLRTAAERAKRDLTSSEAVDIAIKGLGEPSGGEPSAGLKTQLTRRELEELCEPLSRRCLAVCQEVLEQASLKPESLKSVLLVGGMTRVPMIRRLVTELFKQEPVTTVDPDVAVALGAALQAGEISQQQRTALLIDVASNSLGVGIVGGRTRRLIAKNTALPVTAREVFLPGHAHQREARIPVYQGESARSDQNTRLGELVLRDVEAPDRAQRPIEVTFELSQEGMLSVRAMDQVTGLTEAIRIEAQTGLTSAEKERLAAEQQAYAEKNFAADSRKTTESFSRLMLRGQRLLDSLTALNAAAPRPDLEASVAALKMLLELGKKADADRHLEEIAAVRRRLLKMLRARRSLASTPSAKPRRRGEEEGAEVGLLQPKDEVTQVTKRPSTG